MPGSRLFKIEIPFNIKTRALNNDKQPMVTVRLYSTPALPSNYSTESAI